MTYKIQDREAGNLIDTFATLADAKATLAEYIAEDIADGRCEDEEQAYEFYEIVTN